MHLRRPVSGHFRRLGFLLTLSGPNPVAGWASVASAFPSLASLRGPCSTTIIPFRMGQTKSRGIVDTICPTSGSQMGVAGSSTNTRATTVDETSLPDVITAEILSQLEPLVDDFSEIWRYDATTVLKRVRLSPSAEAAAMRLVRERTPVPVPHVIKTIEDPSEDIGYIFMEYVQGDPLDQAWPTYDETQKSNIIDQLRLYLEHLRAIRGDFIGSVDRTVCGDQVFANRTFKYGPYEDEGAFRDGIVESLRACNANPGFTEVIIGMINALPEHSRIVLTHGDLDPRNILVREGRVVAIVDWETAGFYPEYWEYAKAHLFADYEHSWMEEKALDKVLKPYRVELAILLHLPKVFTY